jgi:general secretion pathway protein B
MPAPAIAPQPQVAPPYAQMQQVPPNPAPSPVARTPAPPAPPTPPVKGLPPDAPKLVVNGGTYSERRDLRMAIVNGNVVREGQDVGSGVVVQEIRPDGVILAFRGSRFHVLY